MKHFTFKTSNLNRFLKSIVFVAALIITSSLFSQTVSVDDTKTAEELANQLIDNSCISKSSFNSSSNQSVASFTNNGGSFPISEGIIIRSGIAKQTEGTFSNTNLSSENSTNGDANLQTYSNNEGGTKDITDVGFLEFNFTPVGKEFSFNYIFASNEYSEYQCESGDIFAIILTNLETGVSANIATITDNESVSVKNIRDGLLNGLCSSKNANLFSTYYGDNSDNSSINMRGFTTKLKASATVIPNTKYQIKFVIGDYGNSDLDSAVFIETGSFNNSLDLIADKSLCSEENVVIDSGFPKTDGFKFEWKKNNVLLSGENGTTLTVNSPDTYSITITSLSDVSCQLNSNIAITTITATKPVDIKLCGEVTTINIPYNVQSQILNGASLSNYTLNYFESLSAAKNNDPSILNPTNYPVTNSTFTLWARLASKDNTCFDVVSFNVEITPKPKVDTLPDAYVCNEYELPVLTNGEYYTETLGGGTKLASGNNITTESTIYIYSKDTTSECRNQTSFEVLFSENYNIEREYCGEFKVPATKFGQFYTDVNGPNGTGELIPTDTILTEENTTIYFYSKLNGVTCTEKKFDLIIHPLPGIDTIKDIITCNSYTLDPLPSGGAYYTGYKGSGSRYLPGDLITSSIRLFIYNKNEVTGCASGGLLPNRVFITIIDPKEFEDVTECGSYIIPNKPIGKYYKTNVFDEENIIPAGTEITESKNIYYYADEITTTPNCTGYEISVTINPLPPIDTLDNIVRCEDDLPKLPALKLDHGNYFTGKNGSGTPLSEGDEISSTQTIYIYNTNGTCPVETSFTVTINKKPIIPPFPPQKVCEPFKLPELSFNGRYFTETGGPNGTGTELFAGDFIEDGTQTIYVYSEHPDLATCSSEKSFIVEILGRVVDEPNDVIIACETYVLPPLIKPGNYYKNDDKTGFLEVGTPITETQTIYIIGDDSRYEPCQNMSSFEVKVYNKPNLEDLGVITDINQCGSITLPSITNPDITVEYYNDEDRTDLISDLTIANTSLEEDVTRTIYVRAYPKGNPDCFTEGSFSITIYHLLDLVVKGGAICVDHTTNKTNNPFLIETGLDASIYDIKWYLKGDLLNPDSSQANWSAIKTGAYTIEAKRNSDNAINTPNKSTDCNYHPTEVIIESSTPQFEVNILSNDFSDLYAVEISTIEQGLGNYTYSLDNINFQTSNTFRNINPGTYTVIVRDLENICNDIKLEFTALNNPSYFNPIEGNWNITDLQADASATIDIFDRFGIHIITIKPKNGLSGGWNGENNNGKKMPSTDYWYVLKYTNEDGNPAIFRSHLSLIRK
ncbi:choice-of-anchor L domain-containing protein [Polaribacter sp. Z014]|uniref:choice-of-anchor L domain-containing protein n=1 Tax=Polaribacter sp. Z014 TaxID=2927126 RepID=UPI00202254FF|nr:choice-of-anchor L domain-containing protein [Polaribacter sp. Z014]MCL7762737.1 choice-of-anchor L domain-containing protein [Polaribacter sp. Z014]